MKNVTFQDIPKDVYIYTVELQEDKDVVNMLSVNKTYNDPIYFQRIFKKRYPHLIQYKKSKESWRQFYLRMIFYLSYLKEKFDIDYINIKSFDPIYLYKKIDLKGYLKSERYREAINGILAQIVGETGDKTQIDDFLQKKVVTDSGLEYLAIGIVKSGDIDLFKKYEFKYGETELPEDFIKSAIISQNNDMINYIFEKFSKTETAITILGSAVTAAIKLGNISLFEYYENQIKPLLDNEDDYYDDLLQGAVDGKHFPMIKYLVEHRNIGKGVIAEEIIELARYGHTDNDLNILKYLFSQFDLNSNKEKKLKLETIETINEFRNNVDKDIMAYIDNIFINIII